MANLYELLTPLLTYNNIPEEETKKCENPELQPPQNKPESAKTPKETLKKKPKQQPKRKNKGSTKKTKNKTTKKKKQKIEKVTKNNFL